MEVSMSVSLSKIKKFPGSTRVVVAALPTCDVHEFHEPDAPSVPARYDGRMKDSTTWANMCETHMISHGVGVGTGYGQRLVTVEEDEREKSLAAYSDYVEGYPES
jgi:hypothetical protein